MVYNTILEAVGNTPMVRLNRMPEEGSAEILVKVEALNVGGSIKTRTALNMIEQAEKEGLLSPDSIIVEPTSGNQGIGLALVGAVRGYRTIIIMPDSVSEEADPPLRRGGQTDPRRRGYRQMHGGMPALRHGHEAEEPEGFRAAAV